MREASPISCYDGSTKSPTTISNLWPSSSDDPPAENDADSELFTIVNANDAGQTHPVGKLTIAFRDDNPEGTYDNQGALTYSIRKYPDFEAPHDSNADNTYHLRIVNDHQLTPTTISNGLRDYGCNGSAVDLTVKIKDVGPPAPVEEFTATLTGTRSIKLSWNRDLFNRFVDGGTNVEFPQESFNVQNIRVSHSPTGLTFPRGITANPRVVASKITGIQNIRGTPGTTYTITVQLENSEGLSEPVSHTIYIPFPPNVPDKPTVTAAGPTSLAVSWVAPEATDTPITGYGLRFRVEGETNWISWANPSNTGTSDTITTLKPNTNYQVEVSTISARGVGEWSEPTTATTEAFNTALSLLFPNGTSASMEFDGPLAGNPGSGSATHTFTFARPGKDEALTPAEALITVEGPDEQHDFTISGITGVTPTQFRTLYGDTNSITLNGVLTAENGIGLATELTFTLTLTYDNTPQFDNPAIHQSNNRWTVADTYETYEGNVNLTEISIPWTAVTNGNREWSAGTPLGVTFRCNDHDGLHPASWPTDAEKDSDLFTVTSSASATSGSTTVAFKTAPDYETPGDDEGFTDVNGVEVANPGDNTYYLRITNNHDLHNLGTEGAGLGCDGSAVDIKVKVKDVGTPAPITPTGSFSQTDQTEVNLNWTAPTGFIEDRNEVRFSHSTFNPSSYDYRHRPTSSDSWTEVAGVTPTTATINRLTTHTLQVQVRATNSEGSSPWPDDFVTITRLPQASISAVNSSITEGSSAQFQVTLDRTSSLAVNLTYSWLGGHGSTTGGTVTFSDSNSQALSLPTTSTGTAGSITVTVASGTGYNIGSPSSATVTINRETTPPSTPDAPSLTPLSSTAIRALWQSPTSQQPITSYTLAYSVADTNDWTEITATGTNTDITGLKVGTSYDVQVKAHNSDGTSGFSPSATATTLTLSATIASDQTSVTEGNAASFTVSLSRTETVTVDLQYTWTESHGTATKGSISFTASDSKTISIPTTTTGTTGTLTVAVSSKDAYTVGTSPSASVTINRQITPPSTPAAPSLTPLASTSIRASWQAPTSQQPITSYTLAYTVADENDWNEQTITSTTADLTDLTVNTAYDVEVKAHNTDGPSNWSPRSTARTLGSVDISP